MSGHLIIGIGGPAPAVNFRNRWTTRAMELIFDNVTLDQPIGGSNPPSPAVIDVSREVIG